MEAVGPCLRSGSEWEKVLGPTPTIGAAKISMTPDPTHDEGNGRRFDVYDYDERYGPTGPYGFRGQSAQAGLLIQALSCCGVK